MLNLLFPVAGAIVGIGTGTMISESALMTPKAIALFYVQITKDCYVSTGSKRIACGAATVICGIALVPGPHQVPFITSCAAAFRGANKL